MNITRASIGGLLVIVLTLLLGDHFIADDNSPLKYLLAAVPILVVLGLMVMLRWGSQRAGPAGWLAGLIVAIPAFGLTWDVLRVSQLKGLFLSIFVLAVLWPALLLYNIVDQAGGIRAIARGLERVIADRGLLLIVVAWAFSGMLEGLAGFGLPIAIVAPMLVGLGVNPVVAVAAVAVGHSWSVTFGDMGVIFETLTGLAQIDGAELAPTAALMLGVACLICGLATARILNYGERWPLVIVLAAIMSITQYVMAVSGLTPLAAFGAGLAGMVGGALLGWRRELDTLPEPANPDRRIMTPSFAGALASYGSLSALMAAIALIDPLNDALKQVVWKMTFPEVITKDGFVTEAGPGQIFRPLVHPGTAILLIAILSYIGYQQKTLCPPGSWRAAVLATWRSALPASIGVVAMVGLSTLMDHAGMTFLLAEALSDAMGAVYPLVSPLVGILGAFATGSNNNSNVLFASLQQSAAVLLGMAPRVLLAAQTTGGSLGSMIAPAKIIVGCSTVGLQGQDGEVLRITLPYGLLIGLGLGGLALILSLL